MSAPSGANPAVQREARQCGRGRCRAWVVFVRMASGRSMPVNVDADPAGTVAVHITGTGAIRGRVLTRERPLPEDNERLHVAHAATCQRDPNEPRKTDGAVPLYVARAKAQERRGRPARPVPEGGLW